MLKFGAGFPIDVNTQVGTMYIDSVTMNQYVYTNNGWEFYMNEMYEHRETIDNNLIKQHITNMEKI